MTPTTDKLRALAEQLEAETFVRVSLDDTPHRYYPQTLTAEAAYALRQWIAERERAEQQVASERSRQAYIEEYEQEYGKGSYDQR